MLSLKVAIWLLCFVAEVDVQARAKGTRAFHFGTCRAANVDNCCIRSNLRDAVYRAFTNLDRNGRRVGILNRVRRLVLATLSRCDLLRLFERQRKVVNHLACDVADSAIDA